MQLSKNMLSLFIFIFVLRIHNQYACVLEWIIAQTFYLILKREFLKHLTYNDWINNAGIVK